MAKFEVKRARGGGFVFCLKADNGEVLCQSEVYNRRDSAFRGIRSIKWNAVRAKIEDQTKDDYELQHCPKYEVFMDKSDMARFRLRARNGEIILASQSYASIRNCYGGIDAIKAHAPDAEIVNLK